VESPPSPECPAADRRDYVRDPVRNGVGLDVQWKHQRFREGTSGCGPVGAGKVFMRSHGVFN